MVCCEHELQLKTFARWSKQEAELHQGHRALSRMASRGWEPGAREWDCIRYGINQGFSETAWSNSLILQEGVCDLASYGSSEP